MPEVAREIIQEQMAVNGDALPWKNTKRYTALMLERSVLSYARAREQQHAITLFDRGIPDTVTYARLINLPVSNELDAAAQSLRYNNKVFILPPWEAIYTTDKERKQTYAEAVATYEMLCQTYTGYGYTLIELPRVDIDARLEAVLQHLPAVLI